jgi:hypothetical protein
VRARWSNRAAPERHVASRGCPIHVSGDGAAASSAVTAALVRIRISGSPINPSRPTASRWTGMRTHAGSTTLTPGVAQHGGQRFMRNGRTGRSIGDVDPRCRLVGALHAADRPVEQVLQRARHRTGVLGSGEQECVRNGDAMTKLGHVDRQRVLVVVGIEMRELPIPSYRSATTRRPAAVTRPCEAGLRSSSPTAGCRRSAAAVAVRRSRSSSSCIQVAEEGDLRAMVDHFALRVQGKSEVRAVGIRSPRRAEQPE